MRERRTTPNSCVRRRFRAGDRLVSYGRAASPLAAEDGSYSYGAAGNVTRIERDGKPSG